MTVGSITALSLTETDQRKINFAIQQVLQRNGGQQVNASISTTAAYTAKVSDFLIDVAGATTVTLPSASSAPGQLYCIRKTDAAGTSVTVDPGTNTIDLSTSATLTSSFQVLLIQSNGTQWDGIINNDARQYQQGTWTPSLTFATTGDLSISYASLRSGYYTKIGRAVNISFVLQTSTFTWTTASGNASITGLPFASVNDTNYRAYAAGAFQGITKASYTQFQPLLLGNSSNLFIVASGSGQTAVACAAADFPTGGTVILAGTMTYNV